MKLRAPVSESLSCLTRDQLQKFAQYLISELPQQILPTAQQLLDDLLMDENSDINKVCGAPDPTAGASVNEQTKWCLDELRLHENIRKIVIKLCIPSPMVFSDVNYLSSSAPPAAAEWASLLRPLRGREPEGLWNLLSIVREMLDRRDRNAIPLLKILTEEILACDQILLWWFNTNVSLHRGYSSNSNSPNGNNGSINNSNNGNNNRSSVHSNMHSSQHACSSLCDEIVVLWRLVTLNPTLSQSDNQLLFEQLREWHLKTLSIVLPFNPSSAHPHQVNYNTPSTITNMLKMSDIELFSGFKPAMVSCLIDWKSYPIQGITNQKQNPYNSYTFPINAQSSSSCNHAISGTMAKLGPPNWNPVMFNPQSSGSQPKLPMDKLFDTENFRSNDEYKPNDSNDNSEDSGMNNQEFWDRAFSSDEDNSDNAADNNVIANENNNVNVNNIAANVDEDYQIYVYHAHNDLHKLKNPNDRNSSDRSQVKYDSTLINASQVKPIEDPFEVLFSRAEALYAHGYRTEAYKLSVQLAEQLLSNPPVFQVEQQNPTELQQPSSSSSPPTAPQPSSNGRNHSKRVNRNRFNPVLHHFSLLASATLTKVEFLCQVLFENENSDLLAFNVGLFGLEIVRPPASTKALEVKLAHQEQELFNLLKRIPLCSRALAVLREKAEQLIDGRIASRGGAILPFTLASFIFYALVTRNDPNTSISISNKANSKVPTVSLPSSSRFSVDEKLGFEAAIAVIGMKANISEAEHPLLCEGTRRQRGELALTLLTHYQDDKDKLNLIMDKLLDKDIHQIHRKPTGIYMSSSNDLKTATQGPSGTAKNRFSKQNKQDNKKEEATDSQFDNTGLYKKWFTRFEGLSIDDDQYLDHTPPEPQVANAVDSSAPETTSSDNSPTVSRRNLYISATKSGSESSSSAESRESFSSASSADKKPNEESNSNNSETVQPSASQSEQATDPPPSSQQQPSTSSGVRPFLIDPQPLSYHSNPYVVKQARAGMGKANQYSTPLGSFKPMRYKGKRVHYPVIPNQPSEASAHFMFELAKTLLAKAGGSSSSVLFTQPPSAQTCYATQRNLHMCAFQIGLYALGLNNAVSPNWLSRTYSTHVSWITNQAMEIGHQAISFLVDTWEGHLTPPEVSSLADRASRVQEPQMVQAAAQLALSCLPYAHAMTPNEIILALGQCKEQSIDMLERACLAVESAAQGGGVYPEVLFEVARKWFELYKKERHKELIANLPMYRNRSSNSDVSSSQSNDCSSNADSIPEHANEPYVLETYPTGGQEFGEPQNQDSSCATNNTLQLYPNNLYNQALPFNSSNYNPYNIRYYTNGYPALSQFTLPVNNGNNRYPSYTVFNYPVVPNINPNVKLDQQQPMMQFPAQYGGNFYHPMLHSVNKQQISSYYMGPTPTTSNGILRTPFIAMPNPSWTPVNHLSGPNMHTPYYQLHQDVPYTVANHAGSQANTTNSQQSSFSQPPIGPKQMNYMHASFRVGMLAMETMARRVNDDRPQVKYARNPLYSEDVKWLLNVAKKLGVFCLERLYGHIY